MKCISCEIEINPQWKHAIDQNICPYCGQVILDENLKTLLSDLRETMDKLIQYPNELNDWMLSNFNFIKTDSPKIYDYIDPSMLKMNKALLKKQVKQIQSGEDFEVTDVQDEEVTEDFLRRAGTKKVLNRQQELKEMAQNIKKGNVGGGLILTPEQFEELANDDINESGDYEVEEMVNANAAGYKPVDIDKLKNVVSKQRNGQGNMLSGRGAFSRG
jgi:Zn-finger nucleic acid-binding protein